MAGDSTQPVCYVSTRGRVTGREHTIELWYIEYEASIYLLSGYGDAADWVKNLQGIPEATVVLAPGGPLGERCSPWRCTAAVGPFQEDVQVRQAIDARYHAWRSGNPLSSWAADSLVVRLSPVTQ